MRAASSGYDGGLTGARFALEKAGFAVDDVDLERPVSEQPADLVVLGSYISAHDAIVDYLQVNSDGLRNFCAEGGVIVQFPESPPYTEAFIGSDGPKMETSAFFLPENGLSVKRTRETFWEHYVREPEHPLLAGMDIGEEEGELQWKISEKFGHTATWMAIGERSGFSVLVSNTEDNSRAALVEGAYKKGRYILCSLFFDKLLDEQGAPKQSEAFLAEAERFFANLYSYVSRLHKENLPAPRVSPAYSDPAPAEFSDGAFTLVLIPDTQLYTHFEAFNRHFHNLVDWIVRERDRLNIQYALHLGDIVNRGGLQMAQWDVAAEAMHKMDGRVPYAIALGNHDYRDNSGRSRDTPLNEFFSPSHYEEWPTFGGVMESGHLENSWHTFRAHGIDFLILCLEFGPRDSVLEWANEIVSRHPNHRVILNTHAYTYSDNQRFDKERRGPWQIWNPRDYNLEDGANDGQQMWDKLVDRHPNFFLVTSGHVINDGLGRKSSRTRHGNLVHQMLVNYQGYYRGGVGTVRLLRFLPDRETIQVLTYSTTEKRFFTGPQEQFSLKFERA